MAPQAFIVKYPTCSKKLHLLKDLFLSGKAWQKTWCKLYESILNFAWWRVKHMNWSRCSPQFFPGGRGRCPCLRCLSSKGWVRRWTKWWNRCWTYMSCIHILMILMYIFIILNLDILWYSWIFLLNVTTIEKIDFLGTPRTSLMACVYIDSQGGLLFAKLRPQYEHV